MIYTKKAVEVGKAISAANAQKVQDMHNMTCDMGADCGIGAYDPTCGMMESSRIIEGALPMNTSHDDLRGHLHKAISKDLGVDAADWSNSPSIRDVFPNHVVYSHKGQTFKRPYSVEYGAAGSTPNVKLGSFAKQVHVAYMDNGNTGTTEALSVILDVPEGRTEDMAAMESVRGAVWDRFIERFVSQDERKKAAPEDFAGKGSSFPILKAEDVAAALHSIGRAGSDNYDAATLKKNILAIAKRKGFAVPKSDKSGAESVEYTLSAGEVLVMESIDFDQTAIAREAKGSSSTILMKLIGPGWGSSAYYSPKVLQEAAPVFAKGTHMMWNHQSASEELDRPEGDLKNLAAVLTENSKWMETGPKGPGLYANAKVFSDYAQAVMEKGPHIGVSINAGIRCHEGTIEGKSGRIADQFVKAYSTDFVTKPGAGGAPVVPVSESASVQVLNHRKESNMTDEQITALLESNKTLVERFNVMEADRAKEKADAARVQSVNAAVSAVSSKLHSAGVVVTPRLIERACSVPVVADGKLDENWIKTLVEDFTESFVSGGGRVRNMGDLSVNDSDPIKNTESVKSVFAELGIPETGMEIAMTGGR